MLRPYAGDPLPGDARRATWRWWCSAATRARTRAPPASRARPGSRRWRGCCARRSGTACPRSGSASARSCSRPRTAAWSSAAPRARRSGPALVGRRDAADGDPLFKWVPLLPDVLQWHRDEITELPLGAVLLAASTRYPHQAFRLGDRAWGLQFHIECDADDDRRLGPRRTSRRSTSSATTPRRWSRPPPRCSPTSRRCGSRSRPGSRRSPSARCPTRTSPNPGTGRTLPLLGQ